MANVKISALTAITGASVDQANDVIPIVDSSVPETKKITVAQLLGLVSVAITVGTTTTTGTTGSVLFCDAGVVQQDNTNFNWDNTNNRLGLGAASPAAVLDVRAAGALSSDIGFRVRNSANTRNIIEVAGNETISINSGAYATYVITQDGLGAPDVHFKVIGTKTLSLGTIYNDFGDFNYSGGLYLYNWGSLKTLIKAGGTSYLSESNLAIGGTAVGASATKTISIYNGTNPSGDNADAFQIYAKDIVAGNSAPHVRTENGDIIKIFKGAAVADATGAGDIVAQFNTLLARLRVTGGNGLIAD